MSAPAKHTTTAVPLPRITISNVYFEGVMTKARCDTLLNWMAPALENAMNQVVGAAKLDFEQRAARCFGSLLGHNLGLGERDRVGGDQRLGCRQAGQLVHGFAGTLGGQVPERAIERVAGCARLHRLLQGAAIKPAGDRMLHGKTDIDATIKTLTRA